MKPTFSSLASISITLAYCWLVLQVIFVLFLSRHTVAALPSGFEDEKVVHINQVVDMAFVHNTMLAVAKQGILYTFDLEDPNAEKEVAADLTDRVCDNGERGCVSRRMNLLCSKRFATFTQLP